MIVVVYRVICLASVDVVDNSNCSCYMCVYIGYWHLRASAKVSDTSSASEVVVDVET